MSTFWGAWAGRVTPLPPDDGARPSSLPPVRLLMWFYARQRRLLLLGALTGTAWMGLFSTIPYIMGRGIDEGLSAKSDPHSLFFWVAVLAGVALLAAPLTYISTTLVTVNELGLSFRVIRVVVGHVVEQGALVVRSFDTGEVVASASADARAVGQSNEIFTRAIGGLIVFAGVAFLMYRLSPLLGILVVASMFVQFLLLGPLVASLQARVHAFRVQEGELRNSSTDIVSGLRVIKSIGGEKVFYNRYCGRSDYLQSLGFRTALPLSLVSALEALAPGILLIAVLSVAGNSVIQGDLTVGGYIAAFGYAAFLWLPMSSFGMVAGKVAGAYAGARRISKLLSVRENHSKRGPFVPDIHAKLIDPDTGLVISPGVLTAVVCADAACVTALHNRLSGVVESRTAWGGVELHRTPLPELRDRLLVTSPEDELFEDTLAQVVDPQGRCHINTISAALQAACAGDVVEAVGGLQGRVEARGDNLSGGQCQRLRLARALAHDAPVLVLTDPTSALDATTEHLVAEGIRKYRYAKTTVVLTLAPPLLDRADNVVFLVDGEVRASGRHRALLADEPDYLALVYRSDFSGEATADNEANN